MNEDFNSVNFQSDKILNLEGKHVLTLFFKSLHGTGNWKPLNDKKKLNWCIPVKNKC